MANDVLTHDRDPAVNVDTVATHQGRAQESEERTLARPGAITDLVRDVTSLVKRVDEIGDMLFPAMDPVKADKYELQVLQRENRELRLSVYVLSGLLLLIFLVRR